MLTGALAVRGQVEAIEKTDDQTGKKLIEVWRNPLNDTIERIPQVELRVRQLPKYHICEEKVTLGGQFCAYAVSDDARPKDMSASFWKKTSNKRRLHLAVVKYINDMFGEKTKFSYHIIGGE